MGVGVRSSRLRFVERAGWGRPVTLSSAVVSPVSVEGRGVAASYLMRAKSGSAGWDTCLAADGGADGAGTPPWARCGTCGRLGLGFGVSMGPSRLGISFAAEGRSMGLVGSNAGLGTSSYPRRRSTPGLGVEGVDVEAHLVPLPAANLGGSVMAGV